MTTIVYSVKEYGKNQQLESETWFLSPVEATRAASRFPSYVLMMYELAEPFNPVSLLSRVNFATRWQVIEDTRGRDFLTGHTLANAQRGPRGQALIGALP